MRQIILYLSICTYFIVSFQSAFSQSAPKLNYPLTKENLAQCKDYIFSDAPANMRVKLAIDVISLYNLTKEYQKSVKLGLELLEGFVHNKDQYDHYLNIIRNYSQLMLMVKPPLPPFR